MVVMAAAKAAERLGSAAMAAVTTSVRDACRWPNCNAGMVGCFGGRKMGWPRIGVQVDRGRGNGVDGGGERWKCKGLEVWVKSRVMVGNGAEEDKVAMVEVHGKDGKKGGLIWVSLLVVEPERSILAAADVVLAMAVAAGGRGWLCFPS